ncbi:transmembrane protein 106B-like isoform X2 [Corticium candelabrum]|uniref:transmembrane protein 106B-like isoform X2 n=1 Tax=Corticium candelabrum TaxID=121492 RepID=UPI002E25B063|nr:transmembrane protein 106B-like isoform X2 [Corticium candelabrum]
MTDGNAIKECSPLSVPATSGIGTRRWVTKGGSDVCPTCEGTGVLPKGRKAELVALIPYNDRRLKPSRTKLYVGFTLAVCLIFAFLLGFFLFPRSVGIKLSSVKITNVLLPKVNTSITLIVKATIKFTNNNFYPATAKHISISIVHDHTSVTTSPQEIHPVAVSMRSANTVDLQRCNFCQSLSRLQDILHVSLSHITNRRSLQ